MVDLSKYSLEELEKSLEEPSSTAEDVARGGVAGLEHGGAQLLGLPGSALDLGAHGIGKVADWWSGGENPVSDAMTSFRGAISPFTAPGFEELGNKYVPGMNYEPQTALGKGAFTVGEWAPAIAGGGAGALARGGVKAMERALMKGTTSAAGSEGAGQVAHEYAPDTEPAARMIGALAGYRAPTTAGNIKQAVTAPPAQRVQEVAGKIAAYDQSHSGNKFKPPEYYDLKKEQATHPAYTAPPGTTSSAGLPDWMEPLGYGAAGLATNYFFPGHAAELLGLSGVLAGGSAGKLLAKGSGRAAKGAAGALTEEFKQDPLATSWLAGARAIPAWDASLPSTRITVGMPYGQQANE